MTNPSSKKNITVRQVKDKFELFGYIIKIIKMLLGKSGK